MKTATDAYRDWLLESVNGEHYPRFSVGPYHWRVHMQTPGSREDLKREGHRVWLEICGRPIAEGAEKEE